MVPGKLTWLPETGTIIGSAVTCGAFGYSGYIRMWDPRNGEGWSGETSEPGSGRSSSGRFAQAREDDPWVYINEKNPSMRFIGGASNCVLHCYKSQVFVGREGSLEVWSTENNGDGEGLYRRNFVDKEEDSKRGVIRKIEGGGDSCCNWWLSGYLTVLSDYGHGIYVYGLCMLIGK
ncbi:hypothetical protein OIU76_020868 [Salix suchowensis]|nr:hypothetical protein OIU76_020868 [Salix suchowensis]